MSRRYSKLYYTIITKYTAMNIVITKSFVMNILPDIRAQVLYYQDIVIYDPHILRCNIRASMYKQ